MNQNKIYMKLWLSAHQRLRAVDTDQWYLDFANDMLPVVMKSKQYDEMMAKNLSVMLALYLEDCVADEGNWRQFMHWHKESYGRYLPFYTVSEDYLPDEINREDISLLLWAITPPTGSGAGSVANPFEKKLLALSEEIYNRMEAVFESAPISDHVASDWLIGTGEMEKKRQPLPVIVPGEKLPTDVERFLEANHGEQVKYFDSYESWRSFVMDALKWESNENSLISEMKRYRNFVVYANPKGLVIGLNIARYFADERNPMYNKKSAEKEAFRLFCEEGLCPFDLLKYGVEHNLLPDAQFQFDNGKELLQDNWDFVARWYSGDYYEGQ